MVFASIAFGYIILRSLWIFPSTPETHSIENDFVENLFKKNLKARGENTKVLPFTFRQ